MHHQGLIATAVFIFAIVSITAAAQTVTPAPKPAESKELDLKPGESKAAEQPRMPEPGIVETYHLDTFPSQIEFNDLQTALRNSFSRIRLYALPTENTFVMRGTPEELAGAKKLLASFDHYKKLYRLTYTINDSEAGKRIGSQRFTLVVVSGGKTDLKQGSKVPIVTGTQAAAQNATVEYLDVGLEIEASVDGYADGIRLHTRINQSSVAEDKAASTMQDPLIRQTALEGTSILEEGKPLILGSLDVPGSTRHQEIEVVSELIK